MKYLFAPTSRHIPAEIHVDPPKKFDEIIGRDKALIWTPKPEKANLPLWAEFSVEYKMYYTWRVIVCANKEEAELVYSLLKNPAGETPAKGIINMRHLGKVIASCLLGGHVKS